MTTRRLGIALALWSAGFACVHVAWALGWRGGVPASTAPIADRPFCLAYDVLAAVLMYAAAAVALLLGTGSRVTWLVPVVRVGAVLALLRGVPALALDAVGVSPSVVGVGADAWFVVAGLGGLALAAQASSSFSRKNLSTASTPSC